MHRAWAVLFIAGTFAACRSYDNYGPLVSQDGLVPASRFARYGPEQAQTVAIGRALAQWYMGSAPEELAEQTRKAAEYARTLPDVASVVPDTLGHRLTVTFKSGWRAGIVPVDDGVMPESTAALPRVGK